MSIFLVAIIQCGPLDQSNKRRLKFKPKYCSYTEIQMFMFLIQCIQSKNQNECFGKIKVEKWNEIIPFLKSKKYIVLGLTTITKNKLNELDYLKTDDTINQSNQYHVLPSTTINLRTLQWHRHIQPTAT